MEDLLYLNALRLIPGIGSVTLLQLQRKLSAERIWFADGGELKAYLSPKLLEALVLYRNKISPEREWEKLLQQGIKVTTQGRGDYPESLGQIYDPPALLYYRGSLSGADLSLAVVGSRQATPYGKTVAAQIVKEVAKAGFTIVSGGARGIDSIAHQAALSARGKTLAVLGNGLDVVYPKENRSLFLEIERQGALISEFPLGTQPLAGHFPARNRIISGLSLGTLVVEGKDKSGSLITADCALEQGRDVFAIPGPVTAEGSRGPHRLIKQGAILVESAADVLREYTNLLPNSYQIELADLAFPDSANDILDLLSLEPLHIDKICKELHSSPEKLAGLLVHLELSGQIRQLSGGYYIKSFV